MLKRGQITVFLIVGVIILFFFAGIFFLVSHFQKGDLEQEQTDLPLELAYKPQITSYVENCIEDVSMPGIYLLGIQGGIIYQDNPDKILITESSMINYGYINGKGQLSIKSMEQELNRYVAENINLCLDDLGVFLEKGLEIELGKLIVNSEINPGNVIVNLDYETKITVKNNQLTIDSYSQTIRLPVGSVIEEAKKNN